MSLLAAPYIYMPAPLVGYVINCLTLAKINWKTRRLQDVSLKCTSLNSLKFN